MQAPQPLPATANAIPVDLVILSEETQSPPQQQIAKVPQQVKSALPQPNVPRAPTPEASSPIPPEGVAPLMKQPLPDALDAKLHALALLRQPDTDASAEESPGLSNLSATSNGAKPGAFAAYSLKDYVALKSSAAGIWISAPWADAISWSRFMCR